MGDELQTLAARFVPAVDAEMRRVLRPGPAHLHAFYGMLHYHLGWVDEQFNPRDAVGGKHIRPVLCLLSCAASGGAWEDAVPAGAALELLHNFSLIHDDIQDASPTRRGRATLWRLWGTPQAINAGDAMFAAAHVALGNLADRAIDPDRIIRALRRFDEVCIELTIGQYLDMDFEARTRVGVDEYLDMIGGKTAALLAFSSELGAIIGGAPETAVNHYANFGRDLGLAFQIRDDILGIWGDESLIGKSAATDIATRKKTLPVLFGLAQSEALRRLYQSPPATTADGAFVAEAVALLDDVGARSFATARAGHFSESAIAHLEAAQPAGTFGDALQELAGRLLQRRY